MIQTPIEILPDRDIKMAGVNADFGSSSQRTMVYEGILKIACGFRPGSSVIELLNKLDLMQFNTLTNRGARLLWALHNKLDLT